MPTRTAPRSTCARPAATPTRRSRGFGGRADTTRGDLAAGLAAAAAVVDAEYTTPIENHNPMEPHATIAAWEGDALTVWDATQAVIGDRDALAGTLGIAPEKVRVVSHFVGGGFGCKGLMWSQVPLAAIAARAVGRPVKLVLTRRQMYGPVGARPQTQQHVVLAARRDGTLTAMRHDSVSHTSKYEDYTESCANVTRILYATPNQVTTHRLVKLDLGAPTFQRAPGEAPGTFALESAMDELAVEARHGPAGAAAGELRRDGSGERQAVEQQVAARVLPHRRRAVRVGAAERHAGRDAATATCWWATEWPRPPIRATGCRPPRRCASAPTRRAP